MRKTLLRLQLSRALSLLTGVTRKKSPLRQAGMLGLFLLLGVVFAVLFGGIFALLGPWCGQQGMGHLYFALFALMALSLQLIGGILSAKAMLFDARDNELLLSLPIPHRLILASRMAALVAGNLLTLLPVAIPAALFGPFGGAVGVVSFVVLSLLLTLSATALSALLGWLIWAVTRRSRHKTLLTTVLTGLFLAAYGWGMSTLAAAAPTDQELTALLLQLVSGLESAGPLLWMGRAMGQGSLTALAASAALLGTVFALIWLLLDRTFLQTALASRSPAPARRQRERSAARSPRRALVGKELARFTSSSLYLLNCGLGLPLLLVAGVALLLKGEELPALLPQPGPLTALLPAACTGSVCLLVAMVTISAPSVSLEGSSLWLPKSLPVSAQLVLAAKVDAHRLLTCPCAAFAGLCAAAALRVSLPTALGMVCLPVLLADLLARVGVLLGLRFPNFRWTAEVQVVKQGAAMGLTLLMGILLALVLNGLCVGLTLLLPAAAALAIGCLLVAVLDGAACRLLRGWGQKTFCNL